MPVPVPRTTKQTLYPVIKNNGPRSTHPPSWGRSLQNSTLTTTIPGFHIGLAGADNAPAIKGPPAQASTPPMCDPTSSVHRPAALATGVPDHAHHSLLPPATAHCQPLSPIYNDLSPGSASGPDTGSSPLEPLTPFADFVDNALGSYESSIDHLHDPNPAVTLHHQKQPVLHAAPVFPSLDHPRQYDIPQEQPPVPLTPTGNKRLYEPLSEWIANYVWRVCTTGFSLPPDYAQSSMNAPSYPATPPSYLAPSIHTLLLSTLLQPSAIILAVWYMVRLPVNFAAIPLGPDRVKEQAFRVAFLGDADLAFEHEATVNTAPFRLVVLGCMLANKWLDDHTFSNKTWHSISSIPVQSLNLLESLALDIFGYDLSVKPSQWSKWLAHVIAYHLSLAPVGHPQPISRPSANPHSIVRCAIEELIRAPAVYNSADNVPHPVFLGLEDRLREKREQQAAMDVLEIDLDEDGPLREEYLPKRRTNKAESQNAAPRGPDGSWAPVCHPAQVKALPPPARWSPAGDEPILRDRNRSSAHYVAVQPAPIAPVGYHPAPPDVAFGQNWNALSYMPIKSQTGYMYDMSAAPFRVAQPAYNPFGSVMPVGVPHVRSQSMSYDQDNYALRNHLRSYSQARNDYMYSNLRMTVGEQRVPVPEMESRWISHYPYSGPAFVPIPAVGMQPIW